MAVKGCKNFYAEPNSTENCHCTAVDAISDSRQFNYGIQEVGS